MNHRFVESNGIKMHLAEEGSGPLVVLCHGFPELWYSWRSQLPALAAAHYHDAGFERERDARGFIHPKLDDPEEVVGLVFSEKSKWGYVG